VPAVLLLAFSAACLPAGQSGLPAQAPAGTASSPAAGISVEISQRRGQETRRRLILQVTNHLDNPVVIEAAALHSPLYDGAAAWVPVRAGGTGLDAAGTVSLPVSLPEPRCGQEQTSGPAEAAVELTLGTGSGTLRQRVPAADPFGFLGRSHNQDCLARAAGRLARLDLDPQLETEGSGSARSAVVSLHIAPAGGNGTLSIESPAATTLLDEDTAHPWPRNIQVSGTAAPRTVPLHLVPARCDAHAVAEDKLGLRLPLRLAAGSYRGIVRLEPPPELARAIYSFIASVCRDRQSEGQ
jgi:hypothetical protein